MTHSTSYEGRLAIKGGMTIEDLVELKKLLGIDVRNYHDGTVIEGGGYFIDLVLSDDLKHLEWNHAEKSNNMYGQIIWVREKMKAINPELWLEGNMQWQGEEYDDHGTIHIDAFGIYYTEKTKEAECTCPNCGYSFNPEQ